MLRSAHRREHIQPFNIIMKIYFSGYFCLPQPNLRSAPHIADWNIACAPLPCRTILINNASCQGIFPNWTGPSLNPNSLELEPFAKACKQRNDGRKFPDITKWPEDKGSPWSHDSPRCELLPGKPSNAFKREDSKNQTPTTPSPWL